MKLAKKCVVYILMMALLLTGCAATQQKNEKTEPGLEKYPAYHQQLASLVGQPKQEVCKALNIEESQLVEEIPSLYQTPITVEFGGVNFTLCLWFLEFENSLNVIRYLATYENEPEAAARDAITIAKYLDQVMGAPTKEDKQGLIHKIPQAELQEKLAGEKNYGIEQRWDLREETSQAQKDMMAYLDASEYYTESPVRSGCYLDFYVSRVVQDERVYIVLEYRVGT